MRIIHRISVTATPEVREELASFGVPAIEGLVTFEVDESDKAWPALRDWIAYRRAVDLVRTSFSEDEIASAAWLALVSEWHHGYPQPEDSFLEATYDLSDFCAGCGMGARQKAPFRMRDEPKWGSKGILQLNWVFDEFFVTPLVWNLVFKPLGVPCREVLGANGNKLESVVQLSVTTNVDVLTNDLKAQLCASCGRVKYEPVARGWFPSLCAEPDGDIVKTKQYFGTGKRSYRGFLVSQRCAAAMRSAVVLGASFKPLSNLAPECKRSSKNVEN